MNPDLFLSNLEKAALVFARFSGLLVFAPVFGSSQVPVRVKAWITVFFTLAIFPVVRQYIQYINSPWLFGVVVIDQVLIGLLIGFIFSLILIVFQLAGQIFSFNMGFGVVNTYDPLSKTQVSIVGQYMYLIALMVFLITNAHLEIIYSLAKSFQLVPIMHISKMASIARYTMISITEMFKISMIIAAPVLGTMIILEVALGILARVAPQMNVFVIGFAIKILVGFFILLFFIHLFISASAKFTNDFYKIIIQMITSL